MTRIITEIINMITKRLHEYAKLMRMDKPIGTYLLLFPTLWGLWLAGNGAPPVYLVIIFGLGVFLMRSAGCVMNDIVDRNFDPHVSRTQSRPLAAKTITVFEAIILLIILLVLSLYLATFLNMLTLILSIPALLLALSYPFMKRYHSLPQAHLGLAFGFGIPMSYAAIQNNIPLEAWLLLLINIIWTLIYDTQYAMSDRCDDKKIGVKSSALLFEKWLGKHDYLIIIILQISMLIGLYVLGNLRGFGMIWHGVLVCVAVLFCKHTLWVRSHQVAACFNAFLDNSKIGLIVFIGILLCLLPN